MDERGTILKNGNVLIRGSKIAAIWDGRKPPPGVSLNNVLKPNLGANALIYPGLINLHNHPNYNALHAWPAPSSHAQPDLGRPLGTEPYANRYQWNRMCEHQSFDFDRLVDTPKKLLTELLPLEAAVGKYAEVKAVLGGETAFEGDENLASDGILIRNVEQDNFGVPSRIRAKISHISDVGADCPSDFNPQPTYEEMVDGKVDAWLVHLAEGVRPDQLRPGDPFVSRQEFITLLFDDLLTDMTVIVHGNGLEPTDFELMRAAPSIREDGVGDGLGAKLVWSPLSNLLLYGQTALIYHALKAGVVVSLGTDWSPSGSRNLLDELKIADITLRDSRLLGGDRDLIPALSVTGKSEDGVSAAETALDKLLVEMVTTNPAKTLRWSQNVGTIEVGKFADLMVIKKPSHPSAEGLPDSPYRNLIDATEKDVELVLVGGQPLAGDVDKMASLKPGDYEVITSTAGCFQKAVDVTNPLVGGSGTETFAAIQQKLKEALNSMAGDNPPAGGGPADLSNTYHQLKQLLGLEFLSDERFSVILASYVGFTPDGRLNFEAVQLAPVLVEDDDFYFHLLAGELFPSTNLIADDTPPFRLYPTNLNHFQGPRLGNPFASLAYRDRYYEFCAP
jgi:cytosine/adenosine deaminase-related metal-dependent hydrolase